MRTGRRVARRPGQGRERNFVGRQRWIIVGIIDKRLARSRSKCTELVIVSGRAITLTIVAATGALCPSNRKLSDSRFCCSRPWRDFVGIPCVRASNFTDAALDSFGRNDTLDVELCRRGRLNDQARAGLPEPLDRHRDEESAEPCAHRQARARPRPLAGTLHRLRSCTEAEQTLIEINNLLLLKIFFVHPNLKLQYSNQLRSLSLSYPMFLSYPYHAGESSLWGVCGRSEIWLESDTA